MEKQQEKGMIDGAYFRNKLESLAEDALIISGSKYDYSNEDLSFATLVFVEVFMSKMYDKQMKDNMMKNESLTMAENAGGELRKLIEQYTGVDLHKVYE